MSRIRFSSAMGILLAFWAAPLATAKAMQQCALTTDSIARPCELDSWTGRIRRIAPLYPDILRQAGIGTEAQVEYLVDTAGMADPSTLRIRSGHQLFSNAIRNALATELFDPPRRNGRPTKVRVDEVVVFRHPGMNLHPLSGRSPVTFAVDSTRVLRTTVDAYVLFDSASAPRLTDGEQRAIYQLVVQDLIREQQRRPSAFCIQANREEPAPAFFDRWSTSDAVVVPYSRCPQTYDSMIGAASLRAPTGWVDPVRIDMDSLRPWANDIVLLELTAAQGTAVHYYQCEALRTADSWRVGCVKLRIRVS